MITTAHDTGKKDGSTKVIMHGHHDLQPGSFRSRNKLISGIRHARKDRACGDNFGFKFVVECSETQGFHDLSDHVRTHVSLSKFKDKLPSRAVCEMKNLWRPCQDMTVHRPSPADLRCQPSRVSCPSRAINPIEQKTSNTKKLLTSTTMAMSTSRRATSKTLGIGRCCAGLRSP